MKSVEDLTAYFDKVFFQKASRFEFLEIDDGHSLVKLSPKEQSIFDQVNFVWKTDTSVLLKSDEALQNAILQN